MERFAEPADLSGIRRTICDSRAIRVTSNERYRIADKIIAPAAVVTRVPGASLHPATPSAAQTDGRGQKLVRD